MIKVYEKNKKGKKQIILEINENKIVLENPSIQPHNEYVYRGPKDIMYFYYTMSIYEDINHYYSRMTPEEKEEYLEENENTNCIWRKKTEVGVYEFGVISSLAEFIDYAINFDVQNEGKRTYFWERDPKTREKIRSTTDYECSYTMELNGMCDEDNFYITKYCRYFDSSYNEEIDDYAPKYVEYYKMFIGCGNNQIKSNITGIMVDLREEDLLKFKEWANMFMDYAGEITVKHINDMYKLEEDDYSCPYFLKKHLEKKYPEDLPNLKTIYEQLYNTSSILEEYYEYCKGNKLEEIIVLHRDGQELTAQYFMDQGMKDYEAYIELAKHYYC